MALHITALSGIKSSMKSLLPCVILKRCAQDRQIDKGRWTDRRTDGKTDRWTNKYYDKERKECQ